MPCNNDDGDRGMEPIINKGVEPIVNSFRGGCYSRSVPAGSTYTETDRAKMMAYAMMSQNRAPKAPRAKTERRM